MQAIAHRLIPGGAHTYAKGDDQYPELTPGFIVRGKGCHVWDVDGNEYIEYGMGLRTRSPWATPSQPVVEAARRQMLLGNNFTRPAPIELECAEKLLSIIDGAEMVKFGKNGSDVTTAAVKLARAYHRARPGGHLRRPPLLLRRRLVHRQHGHARPASRNASRRSTVKFRYNDLGSVREHCSKHIRDRSPASSWRPRRRSRRQTAISQDRHPSSATRTARCSFSTR